MTLTDFFQQKSKLILKLCSGWRYIAGLALRPAFWRIFQPLHLCRIRHAHHLQVMKPFLVWYSQYFVHFSLPWLLRLHIKVPSNINWDYLSPGSDLKENNNVTGICFLHIISSVYSYYIILYIVIVIVHKRGSF